MPSDSVAAGVHAGEHRGVDEQRPQRGHGDVVGSPFQIQRLGEAADREFRCAVRRELGLAVDRRRRAEVQHAGAGGVTQVLERGVAAEYHSGDVDVDDLLVPLRRDVDEVAGGQHARVVDQDVQPSTRGADELTERALPRVEVGDVHWRRPYRPTMLCCFGFQVGQFCLVDVDRADGVTRGGEPAHDRQPDAARGARDEDRLRCGHGHVPPSSS